MPEYQHRPDQGPTGDKNFMLYMVMAFLLVMLLSQFLFKSQPQPSQQPTPAATQNQPQPSGTPPVSAPKNTAPAPPVATKQAHSEAETVIENGLYKITFTNHGAQVKSWLLKKYKHHHANPLELVNAHAAAQMGLPLSLWTYAAVSRQNLT